MTQVTLNGKQVALSGELPKTGSHAPDFQVVAQDLSRISLSDFTGKVVVMNTIPSIDTSVCATQLKTFSTRIEKSEQTVLLFVSLDLPFAYARFRAAEGIENVITASDYCDHSLAHNYGIQITSGPFAGIYSRSVVIIDKKQVVRYSELVAEVTNEPDYDAALAALHQLE